jgi:DNA-binding NarL/FixJ family response regulator
VIRLLIADDEALVRAGFRAILEGEPDMTVVGEARDGREAVEITRAKTIDVALMDIRMPVLDGLEAAKQILTLASGPRVLMLTTFDLDEYVYDALKAGASGFLLKDVPREHLITGVRAVHEGESMLAPAITRRLIEDYVERHGHGRADVGITGLSARELDVLRLVARGRSNDEIASDLFISRATVKSHVASILSKLGLRDRLQAVVLAYESGFVQPGA